MCSHVSSLLKWMFRRSPGLVKSRPALTTCMLQNAYTRLGDNSLNHIVRIDRYIYRYVKNFTSQKDMSHRLFLPGSASRNTYQDIILDPADLVSCKASGRPH